jgi:hypothetical protein
VPISDRLSKMRLDPPTDLDLTNARLKVESLKRRRSARKRALTLVAILVIGGSAVALASRSQRSDRMVETASSSLVSGTSLRQGEGSNLTAQLCWRVSELQRHESGCIVDWGQGDTLR